MRYNHQALLRSLTAPWAMHPAHLSAHGAQIARAAEHGSELEQEAAPLDDLVEGQVAVLPILGTMLHRPGMYYAGGMVTYTEAWGEVFDDLVRDDAVAGIVIDADTPGGIIFGTPEISDRIYEARGSKPIVAISNAMAASAGYWATTAADRLYVTPSGEVGSVGVYLMHMDWSKALEDMGIDVSFIHAGDFKVEGNAFEPLGDEARSQLQREVDAGYAQFLAAVARNRGVTTEMVEETFGQGRMVSAEDAVRRGMADGVATLQQAVAEVARMAGVPPVPAMEGREHRSSGLEVRSLEDIEVRAADGDWPLTGAGIPYGRESRDMGGWREMFEPGAFSRVDDDVKVIWQHDPRYVFGRVGAGNARIWGTSSGIRYAAKPPDAQWARDAMESIRRGDVHRSSFGFRVPKGGARWERRDGYDLRVVSRAELVELGPQTHAAYDDTTAAVASRVAWHERVARAETDDLRRRMAAAELTL